MSHAPDKVAQRSRARARHIHIGEGILADGTLGERVQGVGPGSHPGNRKSAVRLCTGPVLIALGLELPVPSGIRLTHAHPSSPTADIWLQPIFDDEATGDRTPAAGRWV